MKKTIRVLVAVLVMALLFSGCATSAAAANGDPEAMGKAGLISSLAMFVPMGLILYFMIIRPDNKRKKQAQEMRESIEVGDKITTIGGMIGRVVHVTNDTVTFECGEDRVRIEIAKWGVSRNDGRGASKEKSDSEEVLVNN